MGKYFDDTICCKLSKKTFARSTLLVPSCGTASTTIRVWVGRPHAEAHDALQHPGQTAAAPPVFIAGRMCLQLVAFASAFSRWRSRCSIGLWLSAPETDLVTFVWGRHTLIRNRAVLSNLVVAAFGSLLSTCTAGCIHHCSIDTSYAAPVPLDSGEPCAARCQLTEEAVPAIVRRGDDDVLCSNGSFRAATMVVQWMLQR